ncbi:hypothetical protein COOONC_08081 [Cooperia oncophora]
MAGLKHTTSLNSHRPVITRPPPVIVPPTQLNISSDQESLPDPFFSPNGTLTSSKIFGNPRYSIVSGHSLEDGSDHHIAQDRSIYDYPVHQCCRGNRATRENSNVRVGSQCYPYRPNSNCALLADCSPHLFTSSPLGPCDYTPPCIACSVAEDSQICQASKMQWYSETRDGLKSARSTAGWLFHSGMNSATVSPVMSTPSLLRRGAASSVNSSVLSSNSSSEAESVKPFTCIPEYCFPSSESPLEGSPDLPLPPAAYADSDEEPYICTKQFPCSQNSDGAVSGEVSLFQ